MNRNLFFCCVAALIVIASLLAFARGGTSPATPDAAYVQSFEKWKAEQTEDLKSNWISLAGLFWLKPGANTFGTAADNAFVFPQGPAHAGEFDLEGKEVTLKLLSATPATVEGNRVTTAKLDPDTSGHTTYVNMGSLRFHVIVRDERVGVRVLDTESAAARSYKGMMFYPLDMNYVVTASFVPSDGNQTVEVPNVLGDVSKIKAPGAVVFKLNGEELKLTAVGGDAKSGLFIVFNDATAKSDTYPSGRFLETDPIADGKVVLDFNRAHNPPCAVTPYATCPLAPKENRLAIAIPAGERFDKAAHAHH